MVSELRRKIAKAIDYYMLCGFKQSGQDNNEMLLSLYLVESFLSDLLCVSIIVYVICLYFEAISFAPYYLIPFVFIYLWKGVISAKIKAIETKMRKMNVKKVAICTGLISEKRFGFLLVHSVYPNESFDFYDKVSTASKFIMGHRGKISQLIFVLPEKAELVRSGKKVLIFKPIMNRSLIKGIYEKLNIDFWN